MLRVRWHSSFVLVLAALAIGVFTLSCGGGTERESVAGPPALAAPDSGGSVTASAADKQAICHYDAVLDTYTTLSLSAQGAAAHLKHGDTPGACPTATCPCFDAAQLALTCDDLVAQCSTAGYWLVTSCPEAGSGTYLGYWAVVPETGSCQAQTPYADYPDVQLSELTPDQLEACKQLIVTSPHYPTDGSCSL